jgi:PAS domain S-box-containing protein
MSFRIGRLAQLSGFEPGLLRAWERRYRLLRPDREENGYRMYTDEDLAVLSSVRALRDQGYSIGDIARMDRDQLVRGVPEAGGRPMERTPIAPVDGELDLRQANLPWSVLDALPLAVIVTNRDGRVRWVNRGVPILCGYDLADLYGLSPGSVLQGPDTDQDTVARLRAAIGDRRPVSVSILNYHRSGEPYMAQLDVSPIGVGDSHVGFVSAARRIDGTEASAHA